MHPDKHHVWKTVVGNALDFDRVCRLGGNRIAYETLEKGDGDVCFLQGFLSLFEVVDTPHRNGIVAYWFAQSKQRADLALPELLDHHPRAGGAEPALAPVNMEVARPIDYQELAGLFDKEFGRLDGILHNASILGDITPLERYGADTWDSVMRVNVNSAFYLTQAMLPLLRASADARVLFTTPSGGSPGRGRLTVAGRDGVQGVEVVTGGRRCVAAKPAWASLLATPYLSWAWNMEPQNRGTHPVRLAIGFNGGNPDGRAGISGLGRSGARLPPP